MIHDVTCWVMEVVILAGDLIPVSSATSAPGGGVLGFFVLMVMQAVRFCSLMHSRGS
jgi:hypothetical protein